MVIWGLFTWRWGNPPTRGWLVSQYSTFGRGIAALKLTIRSHSTEKFKQVSSETREALTTKMCPSPAILPVYVLSNHIVTSRKVTPGRWGGKIACTALPHC